MAKKEMTETQKRNLAMGKKICEETAREYQKKSAEAQKKNTIEKKQNEAFQLSALKALNGIQVDSLKNLADIIAKLLNKENVTPQELKIALDALEFLRDSSGQKPTDKKEISGGVEIQKVFIDQKTKAEAKEHIKDFIEND